MLHDSKDQITFAHQYISRPLAKCPGHHKIQFLKRNEWINESYEGFVQSHHKQGGPWSPAIFQKYENNKNDLFPSWEKRWYRHEQLLSK